MFNVNEILKKANKSKIITFDLFDTLLVRTLKKPSDIWRIADVLISKKFKIDCGLFFKIRSEVALQLGRQYKTTEYTLTQVYENVLKEFKKEKKPFSKKQIQEIRNIEIKTEINFLTIRNDVVNIFNHFIEKNKTIYIISDMYYEKNDIKIILNSKKIFGYKDIIVSSEVKAKKETGKLWKIFFDKIKSSTFHFGDHWNADNWQLSKIHRNHFRIQSSKRLLKKSSLSHYGSSLADSIIYGLIYNKCIFNSPFIDTHNPVNNCYKYGYSILGPLFYYFFDWITKKNDKTKKFVFLAREGFILKKTFDLFGKFFNKSRESCYLLTSRKAAALSCLKNFEDIIQYIKLWGFKGNLSNFFLKRFDLVINQCANTTIKLPLNFKKVIKIVKSYEKPILKKSQDLLSNYKRYLLDKISDDSILIDLGYHCTTQYYIYKILNKKIPGYYFLTVKPTLTDGSGILTYGCFNNAFKPYFLKRNSIFKNLYKVIFIHYIETVLTAPHGQFFGFTKKMTPIFSKSQPSIKKIILINKTFKGIKDFLHDLSRNKNILESLGNDLSMFCLENLYIFFKKNETQYDKRITWIIYWRKRTMWSWEY